MTRGKRGPLTPAKVKPLYGAKRPLPIIERNLNTSDEYVPSPTQQHLRSLAAEHIHHQRLGVESE